MFIVAEADGVRLWKVRDTTPGGLVTWVYFTTRGDVSWERNRGKHGAERMQVPGAQP